jgi:hypothetical protein
MSVDTDGLAAMTVEGVTTLNNALRASRRFIEKHSFNLLLLRCLLITVQWQRSPAAAHDTPAAVWCNAC